jgi:hypothetical protein
MHELVVQVVPTPRKMLGAGHWPAGVRMQEPSVRQQAPRHGLGVQTLPTPMN